MYDLPRWRLRHWAAEPKEAGSNPASRFSDGGEQRKRPRAEILGVDINPQLSSSAHTAQAQLPIIEMPVGVHVRTHSCGAGTSAMKGT